MARPDPFLRTLQALAHTYQAFERYSALHVRTLGNTPGMTATELGDETLITKGTLTGVVDRLETRGWLERIAHERDRRCQIIRLTPAGDRVFATVFPAHLAHLAACFSRVSASQHRVWQSALHDLQARLDKASV